MTGIKLPGRHKWMDMGCALWGKSTKKREMINTGKEKYQILAPL
jgi:hypothetical protein